MENHSLFTSIRKRIYEIVEMGAENDPWSKSYDYVITVFIMISIFPLCFKQSSIIFDSFEGIIVTVFIVDYILRWITADFKYPELGNDAFFKYPFTVFAIVDFLAIVPAVITVHQSFKLIRLFRLGKSFAILKLLRYSKGFKVIYRAIEKEKDALLAVINLLFGYILMSAMVIFLVEPTSFTSFFDAVYWSVVTLTTVGYGDIYPKTDIGRFVSMISSLIGLGMVALPTGIFSAGFLSELEEHKKEQSDKENNENDAAQQSLIREDDEVKFNINILEHINKELKPDNQE